MSLVSTLTLIQNCGTSCIFVFWINCFIKKLKKWIWNMSTVGFSVALKVRLLAKYTVKSKRNGKFKINSRITSFPLPQTEVDPEHSVFAELKHLWVPVTAKDRVPWSNNFAIISPVPNPSNKGWLLLWRRSQSYISIWNFRIGLFA